MKEMHRVRGGVGVRAQSSHPLLGTPLSQNQDEFTNLEASQNLTVQEFLSRFHYLGMID